MKIKVGTSGFGFAQAEYVKLFSCVEVQQTFYQPPRISTLERWRAVAPDGFEFVLKAWQLITHGAKSPTYRRLKTPLSERAKQEAGYFRPTPAVMEAWETTLACARALQARTILFQCPASFTQTTEHIANLEAFFGCINRRGASLIRNFDSAFDNNLDDQQLNFGWEPRGDWDSKVVKRICDDLDLWHVVDPFTTSSVTPDKVYFRLHGRNGWRYEYEDGELHELALRLPTLSRKTMNAEKDMAAYVFFNNARMTQDALRFRVISGLVVS